MALTLPAEILDHILSLLQEDPVTLESCSRSHSLLSSLAEPHLYSHIRLRPIDIPPRDFCPDNFTKLLSERPYIAHYVRNLEIYVSENNHILLGLGEISTILPKLLSLRRIAVDIHCTLWTEQPKCFRLAFWASLCLPSMREVYLANAVNFPASAFLDNRYSSLSKLTLRYCFWLNPTLISQENDVDQAGSSHTNGCLPFECLCLEHGQPCLFTEWSTAYVLPLRSLKFSSVDHKSLTSLLMNYSTTLVNLYLDIGFSWSYCYDATTDPPAIKKPEVNVPDILPMVPCLEELTIRSPLNFRYLQPKYGFFYGIPVIAKIFSSKPPPSFKCLTLDFDCLNVDLSGFCPPLWVSNVICIPLIELLSGFSPSIQINLIVNGNAFTSLKSLIELPPVLTPLLDFQEIIRLFKH